MNDINLIPDRIQYKKDTILKNAGKTIIWVLACAIVLSLLLYRPYQKWKLESDITKITADIANSSSKELDAAKADLNAKIEEKRKSDLSYLNIPKVGIKFNELLKRVTDLFPSTVSIKGINYDWVKNEIIFDLVGLNQTDIAVLLKRLYNDALYTDINISAITQNKADYSFSVMLGLVKN